jgi:hemolysin activation/secretion protein
MKAATAMLCVACWSAHSAWCQITIPPGVDPGQIQRQLQELKIPQQQSPPNLPPPPPEQPVPAQASALRFTLQSVEVSGGTVYKSEQIELFKPLIGHEISAAEIFRLANTLTARYRRDGYILSQVIVPAQSIRDGRVQLLIVEGFIDKVVFRGDVPQDDSLLASYSNKLKATRPLTASALERYLLLMNDLGGVRAHATLLPAQGTTPGAAQLVIDFTRERAATQLSFANPNSRSLGPYLASYDLQWYGAGLEWDRVSFSGGSSLNRRLNYLALGYGSLVGHEGAHWSFDATGVISYPAPAANLTTPDLKSRSLATSLEFDYPLWRSRAHNLYAHASFTTFDGRSAYVTSDLSNDHIRAARAGLNFDVADSWRGVSTLEVELSQGLNILGAREEGTPEAPLSRSGGKADFSKISYYAARLQSLGGPWSLLIAFTGQQAFTKLLTPELFAYGGRLFGRGYDPAELVGDSGEGAKAEVRYAGFTPHFLLAAYTPYAFYDWGRVRQRDPIDQAASDHASSYGLGVRVNGEGGRWQGFVEVAKPIDHVVAAEGNRNARVFFGIRYSS